MVEWRRIPIERYRNYEASRGGAIRRDFGDGEVALSDKMVTNRKGGTCHTCAGSCEPGTRNRVMVERAEGELVTYRWCQSCCFAMAVYDRRPSIGDARFEMGDAARRATLGAPHEG